MKKVIIAFDGMHFPEPALRFAGSLHALSPIHITGVFLNSVDYSALWAFPMMPGSPGFSLSETDTDRELLDANIRRFEDSCRHMGIPYKVHDDSGGMVFEEIKKESRFADILLIYSEQFYQNLGKQPNDYLKTILQTVECPVILAPESQDFPRNIVLAYDGSESSVFAIKQFAYLFPELCKRQTWLLNAGQEAADVPDQVYIEDLVLRHFEHLSIDVMESRSSAALRVWMETHGNPLVVTGAFGRSGLSQLFHKSFLTDLIQRHQTPLFIAHR